MRNNETKAGKNALMEPECCFYQDCCFSEQVQFCCLLHSLFGFRVFIAISRLAAGIQSTRIGRAHGAIFGNPILSATPPHPHPPTHPPGVSVSSSSISIPRAIRRCCDLSASSSRTPPPPPVSVRSGRDVVLFPKHGTDICDPESSKLSPHTGRIMLCK